MHDFQEISISANYSEIFFFKRKAGELANPSNTWQITENLNI